MIESVNSAYLSNNIRNSDTSEKPNSPDTPPVKRGRGRPKGSKNKLKAKLAAIAAEDN